MSRYDDHHPPCRCGCGELADECAGPRPNPLGSVRLSPVVPTSTGGPADGRDQRREP